MKKITILGQKFEYKTCFNCNEFDSYYWTEFYQGTKEVEKKKYIFFGETITSVVPKLVFEISINIEDPYYTKSDIKARLEKEVERLTRQKEIDRGEII